MEIRVLKYFLAVARYKSFSEAAQQLNLTQPTLSRQIKELEDELHTSLFHRTTRSLALTEDGKKLMIKAKEIIQLAENIEMEFSSKNILTGIIRIGLCESECNRTVMKSIKKMNLQYPQVQFQISSGDAQFVTSQLESDNIDLGIVLEPINLTRYDYLRLPGEVSLGVLMRKDSSLSSLEQITPKDLLDKPIIISSQEMIKNELAGWIGGNQRALNIVASYNLFNNAKMMVEESIGYAIVNNSLYQEYENSKVCFKPIKPKITNKSIIIWKKYKVFPHLIDIFLQILRNEIE